MMVISARIAGLLLLFVLVTGKLSTYLAQGGGHHYVGREHNIDVSKREAFTQSENKIMRGRKMMSDHDSKKTETTKEVGVRAKYAIRSRNLISRENYQGRFVAFNADYKGPRHHPPKNN